MTGKTYTVRGIGFTQDELSVQDLLKVTGILSEIEDSKLADGVGLLVALGEGTALPRLFATILKGGPAGFDFSTIPGGVGLEILADFFGFNGPAMRSLPGLFANTLAGSAGPSGGSGGTLTPAQPETTGTPPLT